MAETLSAQEVTVASLPTERELWPGSWRHARFTVVGALVLTGSILMSIGLGGWLRSGRPERAAARWAARLGISTPALWPAGDAMHYPPESAP